jgi:hypothetical protein
MSKIVIDHSRVTKIVLLAVLIIFLAIVYTNANAKNVSMSKIEDQLKSKTDITSMQRCNNRQLMQFMGLDYTNYNGYIYYKSKEALGVDEILIVKVKQRSDLTSVQESVESRIDSQISTFESYGPTQVSLLKNAIVYKKGKYLFYCVAKNPDKYEGVFRHAI